MYRKYLPISVDPHLILSLHRIPRLVEIDRVVSLLPNRIIHRCHRHTFAASIHNMHTPCISSSLDYISHTHTPYTSYMLIHWLYPSPTNKALCRSWETLSRIVFVISQSYTTGHWDSAYLLHSLTSSSSKSPWVIVNVSCKLYSTRPATAISADSFRWTTTDVCMVFRPHPSGGTAVEPDVTACCFWRSESTRSDNQWPVIRTKFAFFSSQKLKAIMYIEQETSENMPEKDVKSKLYRWVQTKQRPAHACTCLHTKWQSLFFQSQPHVRRKVLELKVSFSYQHQLPESLKPWRTSRFPASKLHAVGLWVGEVRMKRHRFAAAQGDAQHRHPGVGINWQVDRQRRHIRRKIFLLIKICWKWSWISQCSLIQKKQTLSWQEFFQWKHP